MATSGQGQRGEAEALKSGLRLHFALQPKARSWRWRKKTSLPGAESRSCGASLALQESSVKCMELQEETAAHPCLPQLCKKLPTEAGQAPASPCIAVGFLPQQQDQLQQEAGLQEFRKLLTTNREALQQEQKAKVMVAQKNESLWQEMDR